MGYNSDEHVIIFMSYFVQIITSNNEKIGVNVVALVNRF